jgi:hypothetical protein
MGVDVDDGKPRPGHAGVGQVQHAPGLEVLERQKSGFGGGFSGGGGRRALGNLAA